MELDQGREQLIVRVSDADDGSDCETRLEIRETRRPRWRDFVRDHDQRPTGVLRLIPRMEQFLLIAPLGIVEQASTNALDEAAREKSPARPPRARHDRRLYRPQAELAEMFE